MVKRRLTAWLSGGRSRAGLRRSVRRGGGIEDAVAEPVVPRRSARLPGRRPKRFAQLCRRKRARRAGGSDRRDDAPRDAAGGAGAGAEGVRVGVLAELARRAQVRLLLGELRIARRKLRLTRPLRRVAEPQPIGAQG